MLVISGPTASGKTALGVALAEQLHGEIVSIDSVQVYRGLTIGSAKPSLEVLARVPHHLIDLLDPHERCDAAWYCSRALTAVRSIQERGRLPIILGGTTMYLSRLLSGMAVLPGRDDELRSRLLTLEPQARFQMLRERDPEAAGRLHPNDTTRVIRAIEVFELTQQGDLPVDAVVGEVLPPALILVLALPRADLRRGIERRTAEMLDHGLIEETHSVIEGAGRDAPSLRSIGYAECAAAIESGVSDRDSLADAIRTSTARLAKRQLTFWRNEPRKRGWKICPGAERGDGIAVLDEEIETGRRSKSRISPSTVYRWPYSEVVGRIRQRLADGLSVHEVWWIDAGAVQS